MTITLRCAHCDQTLAIAPRKPGSRLSCPACGRPVTVPAAESVSATDLAAKDQLPLQTPACERGEQPKLRQGGRRSSAGRSAEGSSRPAPAADAAAIAANAQKPGFFGKTAFLERHKTREEPARPTSRRARAGSAQPALPVARPTSSTAAAAGRSLDQPASPAPETAGPFCTTTSAIFDPEPWFYGVVEKYAKPCMWLGIAVWTLMILMLLVAGVSWIRAGAETWAAVAGTVLFLGLGTVMLLGILVGTALLLLFVDAGRNLRAIRKSSERF